MQEKSKEELEHKVEFIQTFIEKEMGSLKDKILNCGDAQPYTVGYHKGQLHAFDIILNLLKQ